MCGIFGLVSAKLTKAELEVIGANTSRLLAHRGPDSSGQIIRDDGLLLGATRLAIVGGQASNQPIRSADGEIFLVFNGEIYNYAELRGVCRAHCNSTSDGDGDVIIGVYRQFGIRGFEYLDGMFAFALYDTRQRQLVLARDRFGAKPLYVRVQRHCISFASEIRALRRLSDFSMSVNSEALTNYIRFKAAIGVGSIIKDVDRVPPGSALIFKTDSNSLTRFARLPALKECANFEAEKALVRFNTCTTGYMGPSATLLSGGIDSSLAAALLARSDDCKAITVGYSERSFEGDERRQASLVARAINLRHETVELQTRNVPELLNSVTRQLEEPLYAPTALSTYSAFSACADQRVIFCGDGADELFLGYDNFLTAARDITSGGAWLQRYLGSIGWCPVWAQNLFDIDWSRAKSFHDLTDAVISVERGTPLERIRAFEFAYRLPDYQMPRIDRLGMAFSLEPRTPYLRNEIANHFLSRSAASIIADNPSKRALRAVACDLLPPEVVTRPKRKFAAPTLSWIAANWDELVVAYILDNDLHPIGLSRRNAQRLVSRCKESGGASAGILWGVLVLGVWSASMLQ